MAAPTPRWKKRTGGGCTGPLASLSLYSRVILVAYREVVVRNMATMLMEMEGNLVLSASHGWEALRVSRMFNGMIDLAITDADLPGLECADLCWRLLEERPGIKVLVLSTAWSKSLVVGTCGLSLPPTLFDAGTLRAQVRAIAAAPALSFPYVYMMFPGNPSVDCAPEAALPHAAEYRRGRTRHAERVPAVV